MPFVMDQQSSLQNLKNDRGPAQEANLPPKPAAPLLNGAGHSAANDFLSNGSSSQHAPSQPKNGDLAGQPITASDLQKLPELDQSWRDSEQNKSMGKLIERLSQQCFLDLGDTLTSMAETPAARPSGQPNGISPYASDSDNSSLSKKRAFMDFANGQRDRFIKTLVLSDWARNGEQMARLIDLRVWQVRQAAAQRKAIEFIGHTKNDLRDVKAPGPNIQTALELLGTGKASQMPDLGYLPAKRLTAKQLLRTLQNMNVTLATRLNLTEDLPKHFDDFTISNGRATFRVPGEFEVDLSVADEDQTSQFYFIDMRFSFKPAPVILDEGLRTALEARTNTELSAKGLKGCYDFLHNVVLTHKINLLRDQAIQLCREQWFNCVRLHRKGRTLVIQYWVGSAGRSSWIEIGVSTGKETGVRSEKPSNPHISFRWFRKGELVENPGLEFNWENLDVEKILSCVISQHISWIFSLTKDRLEAMTHNRSQLDIKLQTSSTGPEKCSLRLILPGLASPTIIRFEAITGRISISPPTSRAAAVESGLNNDPNPDLARILALLLCKLVQDRVDKARELAGWEPVRAAFASDNLKTVFGSDLLSYKMYACNKGWSNDWAVFVTFSLSGQKWWVGRLENKPDSQGNPDTKTIMTARKLPFDSTFASPASTTRTSLLQIEKLAVAEVSFAVLSHELSQRQVAHRMDRQSSMKFQEDTVIATALPNVALFFRSSTLLQDRFSKDLAIDCIRLTHKEAWSYERGNEEVAHVRHGISLTVNSSKLKHLRNYLATKGRNSDIAMNSSGALALKLRTPFGQPYLDNIIGRIKAAASLDHYLDVMQRCKFKPTTVTFSKVAFTYRDSPELSASLIFRGENSPAKLKLEPAGANPHHRVRVLLEKVFSIKTHDAFMTFCQGLTYSLPALVAFDKIEAADLERKTCEVHSRSPLVFKLAYKPPLPTVAFAIEVRKRDVGGQTNIFWALKTDATRQALQESDFGKALLDYCVENKDKNKAWWGLEDGTFCAHPRGIGEVIEKLDEFVRKFAAGSSTVKLEEATKAEVKSASAKQQPPPPPAPVSVPAPAPAQRKPAQQQKPPQQKPAASAPRQKPGPPNTHTPAPTANMMPNTNRNNAAKIKKEVIELD